MLSRQRRPDTNTGSQQNNGAYRTRMAVARSNIPDKEGLIKDPKIRLQVILLIQQCWYIEPELMRSGDLFSTSVAYLTRN